MYDKIHYKKKMNKNHSKNHLKKKKETNALWRGRAYEIFQA